MQGRQPSTAPEGRRKWRSSYHVAVAAVALLGSTTGLLRWPESRWAEDTFLWAAAFGAMLATLAGIEEARAWPRPSSRTVAERGARGVGWLVLAWGTALFGFLLLVRSRPELYPDASFAAAMVVGVAARFGFALVAPVLAWVLVRITRSAYERAGHESGARSDGRALAFRTLSVATFAGAVVLTAFTLASLTALAAMRVSAISSGAPP